MVSIVCILHEPITVQGRLVIFYEKTIAGTELWLSTLYNLAMTQLHCTVRHAKSSTATFGHICAFYSNYPVYLS